MPKGRKKNEPSPVQLELLPRRGAEGDYRVIPLDQINESESLMIAEPPSAAFIKSVRDFGVLTPVLVVSAPLGYKLAAGTRRLKAAQIVGLKTIPAMVYPADWTPAEVLTLIENDHRKPNHARAYASILELIARAAKKGIPMTAADIQKTLRLPAATVNAVLKIQKGLDESGETLLRQGHISLKNALLLSRQSKAVQAKVVEEYSKSAAPVITLDLIRFHAYQEQKGQGQIEGIEPPPLTGEQIAAALTGVGLGGLYALAQAGEILCKNPSANMLHPYGKHFENLLNQLQEQA